MLGRLIFLNHVLGGPGEGGLVSLEPMGDEPVLAPLTQLDFRKNVARVAG